MTYLNLKKALLFCSALLFAIQFQISAQNFEGVIYYEIPEMKNQGMSEMPYMIKDSKARIEFGEGQQKGAMLFLPEESKMVFIIEAMKGYMEMDLNETQEDSSETPDITKTGETKTIAGKDCEIWIIKSSDSNVETCMAQNLGTFMMPNHPMDRKNSPDWVREIMENGTMPLEVIELGNNGKKTTQMIATRIEEKALDSSLFEIPDGYNNMTSMMKQMMDQNQ